MAQETFAFKEKEELKSVEEYRFEPIKGYPMLHWKGKRPFTGTQYYPAQLKENHGEEVNGWMNKIFWGDNLQVMSHLLKQFRGQIKFVYIDPPFDSNADYKKEIAVKGQKAISSKTVFEEKQYTDLWNNDEYLQFMYERLLLLRELISEDGSLMVHCDNRVNSYLRIIMDEIFGRENFINEIIWQRRSASANTSNRLDNVVDSILFYKKTNDFKLNEILVYNEEVKDYVEQNFTQEYNGRKFMFSPIVRGASRGLRDGLKYEYKGYTPEYGWMMSKEKLAELDKNDRLHWNSKGKPWRRTFIDEYQGQPLKSLWTDVRVIHHMSDERLGYPTQKPQILLDRIIELTTEKGDIVLDCFMGSGTTQAVAMKKGRRFIGADINLGAIQTTTKRLVHLQNELKGKLQEEIIYYGFQIYNVNHYDVFRNPIQAKEILIKALEIQPLPHNNVYDGEKDGRMVKIMPINRIATKADLNELITNFDYKAFEKAIEKNPGKPVESLLLVCMGHEPDLAASLQNEVLYKLDIEVVDILRDNANLEFKRDAEAEIVIEGGKLVIREFFPMNLLQKLSLQKENVENWKELVDSVMIDFNYDGAVFEPQVVDVPEGNNLVKGVYNIPANAGTIRVKITDLLSETLEQSVTNG